MHKSRQFRFAILALAAVLASCGGGGSSNNNGGGQQAFGGLWDGTWSVDGGDPDPEIVIAISTDEGKFQFLLPALLIQASGTAVISGNQVVGTGLAYTPAGDSFPDNSTVTGFSFTGTIDQRNRLTGNWQIDAGDTGAFEMIYDPLFERDASLAALDGSWIPVDFLTEQPGPAFSISNGNVFRQTPACTSNSTISIPDAQFNAYEWTISIAATGSIPCPVAGEYEGLATLGDSEDGGSNLNDTQVVLASNTQSAIALLLIKSP